MTSTRVRTMLRVVMIGLAAALSGAAALGYEIAWSRALVVPLGNSSDANALVLAVFMLGIGVGAKVAGGLAEKVRAPLKLYALAEAFLGVCAFLIPFLLSLLTSIPGDGAGLMRWLAAIPILLPPCLAMGATLPFLVRALTIPKTSLNLQIGMAYGVNTAGAALGAIVTGFYGLAAFGISTWSAWACIGSFAAAILAFAASRRVERQSDSPIQSTPAKGKNIALVAAFVMGFLMLALEVLWARVLTFVFGHDTYAFATLLAYVLVGLSLGGLLHRGLARRNQAHVLAWLFGLFGLVSWISFWIGAELVIRFGRDPFGWESVGALATSLRLELFRELSFTPVVVLLPSVIAGAAFPAACSLYGQGAKDAGRRVGNITLVNGIGGAAGSLSITLGLATLTGIQGAFLLLAFISTFMAAGLLFVKSIRKTALVVVPIAAILIASALLIPNLSQGMILATVGTRHQTFLHYEEARTGVVSVIENQINQERQLLINAVNEVTTRLVHDQSFKVLGHLGPLLHPNPKKGVMICLGAGISAGAALTHPLEKLDVVDLSSAVARGARKFSKENNNALDDPRLHLHIDDGRQYLLNTQERFDVAIIDSTHPKAVDSWILYTVEFYNLVRDRLDDDGILVQWLPLHGLSEKEFKIILRTFLEAFPSMTLWANVGFETYGQVGYAKLLGTKKSIISVDLQRLSSRLNATPQGQDLAAYGMDGVEELLDLFVAGPEGIGNWVDGMPLQSDDHPLIPYTTDYSMGRPMVPSLLLGLRESVVPWLKGQVDGDQLIEIENAAEAQGLVVSGRLNKALEIRPNSNKLKLFREQATTTLPYYEALAQRYPDEVGKLFEAGTQLAGLGHPDQAKKIFEQASILDPKDFRLRLNGAHLALNRGDTKHALDKLVALRKDYPREGIVHFNLGEVLMARGDPGTAIGHFEAALAWEPTMHGSHGAKLALARALMMQGEAERGESLVRELLRNNPWDGEAWFLLGHLHALRGQWEEAERCHEKASRMDPYNASILFDLGGIQQRRGAFQRAERTFRMLLRYEPTHGLGRVRLGDVLGHQGKHEEAVDMFLLALDAEPSLVAAAVGLGQALRRLGREEQARDAYCLALGWEKGAAEAREALKAMGLSCDAY